MAPASGSFGSVNGGPWWARALYVYGVPSAIALFLVYQLTEGFADDLRAHAESTHTAIEELIQLTTVICVNEADDQMERNRCFATELLQVR